MSMNKYILARKKGFTLIEIITVVAILGLLAALAIPFMLRNTITANEAVAIAGCKTILSACQSYYAVATMPRTYPPDLISLGQAGPTGPAYIDSSLASGTRAGYTFNYQLNANEIQFTLNADPQFPGKTGNRYFYIDEYGRITAKEGGQAGPDDPTIQ